jgi:predicted P-loop ATPase
MPRTKKGSPFKGMSLEAFNLLRQYPAPFTFNQWTLQAEISGKPVTDDHIREISFWLQSRVNQEWTKERLWDAVITAAKENTYNPLVAYLTKQITWSGEDSIQRMVDLMQPLDSVAGVYMKRWLISAVRRALLPGSVAQLMLILVGPQGIGKSFWARDICPFNDQGYFIEDFNAKVTRDEKMKIRGAWIVEMSELKGMREANMISLKSFLTTREDSYRVPWGKAPLIVPRRCVFIGTTNETHFLRDETGERRFMIIESMTRKGQTWNLNQMADLRDDIWAQAMYLNSQNEPSYLYGREAEQQAENNKLYAEVDPWTDAILSVATRLPEVANAWALIKATFDLDLLKLEHVDQRTERRVTAILQTDGWLTRIVKRDGKSKRVWVNPRFANTSQ